MALVKEAQNVFFRRRLAFMEKVRIIGVVATAACASESSLRQLDWGVKDPNQLPDAVKTAAASVSPLQANLVTHLRAARVTVGGHPGLILQSRLHGGGAGSIHSFELVFVGDSGLAWLAWSALAEETWYNDAGDSVRDQRRGCLYLNGGSGIAYTILRTIGEHDSADTGGPGHRENGYYVLKGNGPSRRMVLSRLADNALLERCRRDLRGQGEVVPRKQIIDKVQE